MLNVRHVDQVGEMISEQLEIAAGGKWGRPFDFGKAPNSDYWRGQSRPRRNWVQLNGNVYQQESYGNWKIQARFLTTPSSGFWVKKTPYKHGSSPHEWSLGGEDVWAISYENMAALLQKHSPEELVALLLQDLRLSWSYAQTA